MDVLAGDDKSKGKVAARQQSEDDDDRWKMAPEDGTQLPEAEATEGG
jgi:hypothetical protein